MREQVRYIWRVFFPKRQKSSLSLWQQMKKSKASYMLLAPYFILFTIFTIIPVAAAIVLGFTYFNMLNVPEFIGLSNYKALFLNDEIFLLAIKNTIVFAVITNFSSVNHLMGSSMIPRSRNVIKKEFTSPYWSSEKIYCQIMYILPDRLGA